jgi:hypothetical protein
MMTKSLAPRIRRAGLEHKPASSTKHVGKLWAIRNLMYVVIVTVCMLVSNNALHAQNIDSAYETNLQRELSMPSAFDSLNGSRAQWLWFIGEGTPNPPLEFNGHNLIELIPTEPQFNVGTGITFQNDLSLQTLNWIRHAHPKAIYLSDNCTPGLPDSSKKILFDYSGDTIHVTRYDGFRDTVLLTYDSNDSLRYRFSRLNRLYNTPYTEEEYDGNGRIQRFLFSHSVPSKGFVSKWTYSATPSSSRIESLSQSEDRGIQIFGSLDHRDSALTFAKRNWDRLWDTVSTLRYYYDATGNLITTVEVKTPHEIPPAPQPPGVKIVSSPKSLSDYQGFVDSMSYSGKHLLRWSRYNAQFSPKGEFRNLKLTNRKEYDLHANVTMSMAVNDDGIVQEKKYKYQYDQLGRLIHSEWDGGSVDLEWFDDNRIAKMSSRIGSQPCEINYHYQF